MTERDQNMELIGNDFGKQIRQNAIAFGIALRPAFEHLSKVMNAFGETYMCVLERAYKKEFGKLPASMRTKRLRKKRRTIVLKWFSSILNEEHNNRLHLASENHDDEAPGELRA